MHAVHPTVARVCQPRVTALSSNAHLLDGRIVAWPEGERYVRELLEVIDLHDAEHRLQPLCGEHGLEPRALTE